MGWLMDYDQQIQAAMLRQRDASGRSQYQNPEGRMVSGRYVAPNFLEYLSAGLRSAGAGRDAQMAGEEAQTLQKQKQEAMQGDMSAIIDALRDKPAETVQPLTPNDDEGNVNPPIQMPARAGSLNRAYEVAAKSQFPQFQQFGMQGALTSAQKQAELAQQEEQRQKYGQMLKTMTPDEAIAAGVPKEIVSGYYEAKNYGKTKVGRTIDVIGANGEKMTQQIDEYGNAIGAPIPAYTAPVQVNQGGQVSFVVPKAGVSMPVTMSPSEKDASARGWATVKQGAQRLSQDAQGNKAPAGYRWRNDGSGLEAIPGGPADIKAGELGAKSEAKKLSSIASAENVRGTISEAKDLVGWNTAGAGSLATKFPATDARNLAAKLETIKGNLGFDRLQQMRDQSPTGGALGAVAVQELTALQSTVASLDQGQSPAELRKALDKIDKHYENWQAVMRGENPYNKPKAKQGQIGSGSFQIISVE